MASIASVSRQMSYGCADSTCHAALPSRSAWEQPRRCSASTPNSPPTSMCSIRRVASCVRSTVLWCIVATAPRSCSRTSGRPRHPRGRLLKWLERCAVPVRWQPSTPLCGPVHAPRGEIWRAAIQQAGRRGIVAVRELLPLADERAESPMESEARLAMIDGGLPIPELQFEVVDGNNDLRRLDFAWPRTTHRGRIRRNRLA